MAIWIFILPALNLPRGPLQLYFAESKNPHKFQILLGSTCLCIYLFIYMCIHWEVLNTVIFLLFSIFSVQHSLKAQLLPCANPSNYLHWKEVLIHEMDAEILLSSLPVTPHVIMTCAMCITLSEGRHLGKLEWPQCPFIWSPPFFPPHPQILSQPLSTFLECSYHSVLLVINYFKPFSSCNSKKTCLSNYKPHVLPPDSGCTLYLE